MQLRAHPKMRYRGASSWPPQFGGSYGRNSVFPIGEEGVLTGVRRVPALAQFPEHLSLEIEHRGGLFSGPLVFDDPKMLDPLFEALEGCTGRTLREIGDLEVEL